MGDNKRLLKEKLGEVAGFIAIFTNMPFSHKIIYRNLSRNKDVTYFKMFQNGTILHMNNN